MILGGQRHFLAIADRLASALPHDQAIQPFLKGKITVLGCARNLVAIAQPLVGKPLGPAISVTSSSSRATHEDSVAGQAVT